MFVEIGERLLSLVAVDPDRLITLFVGIVLPVCIMALILNWKIQQAEKKKRKQVKNKEKLIKFLKGEKKQLGSLERVVKAIKPSLSAHEKQE